MIIKAIASAEANLSENTYIEAVKLEEGSAEYEVMKALSSQAVGADGDAQYSLARYDFVTMGEPYVLKKLAPGSYILSEVASPDGYQVAADVTFTVTSDRNVTAAVTMVDERIARTPGKLSVTKNLTDISGRVVVTPDSTFYVALFADAERTQRVSDVKEVHFTNSSSQTVSFDNLSLDTAYYVSETDEYGTPIDGGEIDGGSYAAIFADGQEVRISTEQPEGEITFENMYAKLSLGNYYAGELTITKRVLRGAEPFDTNETFYTGIFEDPDHTVLYGDVVALTMDGSSEYSVTIPGISVGMNENDSKTYYVTETTADGTPIEGSRSLAWKNTQIE